METVESHISSENAVFKEEEEKEEEKKEKEDKKEEEEAHQMFAVKPNTILRKHRKIERDEH